MILRSATLLTAALGLRTLLTTLPALGGALVLPLEEVANVTLGMAIVTPFFLASAMGIPQRVSTGDYDATRYGQLHAARLVLGLGVLPLILAASFAFPVLSLWLVVALFATRLFEGQAEVSAAILTCRDRPSFILGSYGLLVGLYVVALVVIAGQPAHRLELLMLATVSIALFAMVLMTVAARRHHEGDARRAGLLDRAMVEIRHGFSLGLANGLLSLTSYLPRYLLSAIGLHVAQGAFAIAQLLVRQFSIAIQGLLFARGGALLPASGSDRRTLDRFLAMALLASTSVGLLFCAAYVLLRDVPAYSTLILAQLAPSQTILSILVGALFLLRFSVWLLATRFLSGAVQLRIALYSAAAALLTACLLLVAPRFEVGVAVDIVANIVIIMVARRAILNAASPR